MLHEGSDLSKSLRSFGALLILVTFGWMALWFYRWVYDIPLVPHTPTHTTGKPLP